MNTLHFTCTNCGEISTGSYCAACGQKKFHREDFTLSKSVQVIVSEFSDVESSFGKTFLTLIRKPGKLTVDYLTGRQKSYATPFKLYLIVITINFVVYAALEDYSFVNVELLKNRGKDVAWFQQAISQAQAQSGLPVQEFFHRVNSRVTDILPVLLYFLIFAQALVLKIQFWGHDRYYIEHLIFALHFMSFGFLRDVALLPVQFWNTEAALAISIITTVGYLFLSLKTVYRLSAAKLLFHTLMHYAIFFVLFIGTIVLSVLISISAPLS
jgi:hypothetical protein